MCDCKKQMLTDNLLLLVIYFLLVCMLHISDRMITKACALTFFPVTGDNVSVFDNKAQSHVRFWGHIEVEGRGSDGDASRRVWRWNVTVTRTFA